MGKYELCLQGVNLGKYTYIQAANWRKHNTWYYQNIRFKIQYMIVSESQGSQYNTWYYHNIRFKIQHMVLSEYKIHNTIHGIIRLSGSQYNKWFYQNIRFTIYLYTTGFSLSPYVQPFPSKVFVYTPFNLLYSKKYLYFTVACFISTCNEQLKK